MNAIFPVLRKYLSHFVNHHLFLVHGRVRVLESIPVAADPSLDTLQPLTHLHPEASTCSACLCLVDPTEQDLLYVIKHDIH